MRSRRPDRHQEKVSEWGDISVRQHYKIPANPVGLVKSRSHHQFNDTQLVLAMIQLENYLVGAQQQLLTHYYSIFYARGLKNLMESKWNLSQLSLSLFNTNCCIILNRMYFEKSFSFSQTTGSSQRSVLHQEQLLLSFWLLD